MDKIPSRSRNDTVCINILSDIIRSNKHQNVAYAKDTTWAMGEEVDYALLDVMIKHYYFLQRYL